MDKNNICCDVCSCKHNERGCDCCLDKVRITTGDDLKSHHCGSYECKEYYQSKNDINERFE